MLGILLGLVLLLAALLLFCPVRYRASACKEGVEWKLVKASAGVSWLFGGIAVRAWFEEGGMHTGIRIFGIPIDKFLKKKMDKAASAGKRGPKTSENSGVPDRPGKESVKPGIEPDESGQEPEKPGRTEAPEIPQVPAELPEKPKRPGGIKELIRSILEKLRQILATPFKLLRALAAIPGRIAGKIRNIALTFRGIYDKIDWWKQFVNHPRTQEAISLVWNHAKGLLRHVMPTKIEGKVTFGSENPAVTGMVLAVLGMSIPLHKNCIAVNPLFEGENVLEGDVRLKGRIYGWVLLKAAVTIYLNKNVKYVINRWKHKEG